MTGLAITDGPAQVRPRTVLWLAGLVVGVAALPAATRGVATWPAVAIVGVLLAGAGVARAMRDRAASEEEDESLPEVEIDLAARLAGELRRR